MKNRSARATALGASVLVLGATLLTGSGATAAAGNPGVPADPTVLLSEGFDTGVQPGSLTQLEDYVPTFPTTYSADAPWLNPVAGNGLIIDGTTPDSAFTAVGYLGVAPGVGSENMRELATVLGNTAGKSQGAANFAVTAYTDANPGANAIEFTTEAPLNLDAGGRFLTVSANVAAVNCARALAPALVFYLVDGTTETRVNNTALNPCTTAPAGSDDAYATTLLGGNAALFTGDAVGIVLRNEQGSGGGNDHAYDDITLLDVTPQLDKKFTDEGKTLAPGTVTNLVLTVTNTSELSVKDGWSFTDNLPAGLTVAGDVVSTCDATVTAPVGAASVVLNDGLLDAGEVACELTVPVKATATGTYTNSAANVSAVGLNLPGSSAVSYAAPAAPAGPGAPLTGLDEQSVWPLVGAGALGVVLLGGVAVQARRRHAA
ncbi:hypothetical protein [Aeromicrobium alkaliterrae]|uniref:DUF7933 domain-containing protein n=1 Tax=Aeromicrobium alkaliterrae TaxID=302168 RepID=A0ABP4W6H3_9ACTN